MTISKMYGTAVIIEDYRVPSKIGLAAHQAKNFLRGNSILQ